MKKLYIFKHRVLSVKIEVAEQDLVKFYNSVIKFDCEALAVSNEEVIATMMAKNYSVIVHKVATQSIVNADAGADLNAIAKDYLL